MHKVQGTTIRYGVSRGDGEKTTVVVRGVVLGKSWSFRVGIALGN